MTTATFYHGGCAVCSTADRHLLAALDPARYRVERIDLNGRPDLAREAETLGVKTIPALVIGGAVFHINHGADLSAVL